MLLHEAKAAGQGPKCTEYEKNREDFSMDVSNRLRRVSK